ncbi:MAG: toprim domain-containing protein, partial [Tissierellia bacterium]|nr:toprim domain-containing protein [Tissierellia bacterium]
DRDRIILVEGYTDVIALYENGIDYAVAGLGTAFTANQAKLLKRYGKDVYICYDSDTAGMRATMRTLKLIMREGVEPKVVLLPQGDDPDDFINENGLEEFQVLLDGALNPMEYEMHIYRQRYDLTDADDKIKFTKEISKSIRGLKSPVERDVYIDRVSTDTGISRDAIAREVLGKELARGGGNPRDKYINRKYRDNKNKITPIQTVLEPAHLIAEKTLVKLMVDDRNYYNIIRDNLNSKDFFDHECRILVDIISQRYEGDGNLLRLDISDLVEGLEEHELDPNILDRIGVGDIKSLPEDKARSIDELLVTIEYYKLRMKRDRINERIQYIESKGDLGAGEIEEINRLCLELTELNKELRSYM